MTALPSLTSDSPRSAPITRFHRARLMQIWRSAGWPCKDGLEIDLLAAGLISLHIAPDGCETLRLTDEGIRTMAQARQRSVRALSLHDRLGQKICDTVAGFGADRVDRAFIACGDRQRAGGGWGAACGHR